jgi:hypothetical protein
MQDEPNSSFHSQEYVLQNYWIIIDMVILFLAQSYISISLYMKVSGEVVKNLYSLYFLQQSLLSKQENISNII